MKIVEITREEVINNCEKYFENKQQFLIKTKDKRELRNAYLYKYERYHDNFGYCFDYDEGESASFGNKNIEHIYILK